MSTIIVSEDIIFDTTSTILFLHTVGLIQYFEAGGKVMVELQMQGTPTTPDELALEGLLDDMGRVEFTHVETISRGVGIGGNKGLLNTFHY